MEDVQFPTSRAEGARAKKNMLLLYSSPTVRKYIKCNGREIAWMHACMHVHMVVSVAVEGWALSAVSLKDSGKDH